MKRENEVKMDDIDKALEELMDMTFHPSLKKELSTETLAIVIYALEKMKETIKQKNLR